MKILEHSFLSGPRSRVLVGYTYRRGSLLSARVESTMSEATSGAGKRKAEDEGSSSGSSKQQDKKDHATPRTPLVICTSGVYGEDLSLVQRAAEVLHATIVDAWSDAVTHLIMVNLSWTPKLLSALASLVPVVSPRWVVAAAAAAGPQPGAPLPDVADPEFAPKSPSPSMDSVAFIRPERATLFKGRKYISLPGGDLTDTRKLLEKMGATCEAWPAELGEEEPAAFVRRRASGGWEFLNSSDEKWPTSDEAKTAVAAGADLISPMVVRTSLIMARRASVKQVQRSNSGSRSMEAEKLKLVRSGEQ